MVVDWPKEVGVVVRIRHEFHVQRKVFRNDALEGAHRVGIRPSMLTSDPEDDHSASVGAPPVLTVLPKRLPCNVIGFSRLCQKENWCRFC